MKNLLSIAILSLIVAGCGTFGGGQKSEAAQLASLARVTAYTATAFWLQSHPEDRAKFQMAHTAIDSLLLGGAVDPLALREAMALLPTDELRADNSAIFVTTALLLLEGNRGEMLQIDTPEEAKGVALAIRDGLGLALAGSP